MAAKSPSAASHIGSSTPAQTVQLVGLGPKISVVDPPLIRLVINYPPLPPVVPTNPIPEKNQPDNHPTNPDNVVNFEKFIYLQKAITDPASAIVQHQVASKTAKILVVYAPGVHCLFEITIPAEECSVKDLLEQLNFLLNDQTRIMLVSDTLNNINYIVESKAGFISIMYKTSEAENMSPCDEGRTIRCPSCNARFSLSPETWFACRSVWIGSYKYVPTEKIFISKEGMTLVVPLLEDQNQCVTLNVKSTEIVKALMYFGKTMPVFFFYLSPNCGANIREILGMQDPKGPYFDPAGKHLFHQPITLMLDTISEEIKQVCNQIFPEGRKMRELSAEEANDTLISVSTKDLSQMPIIITKLRKNPVTNLTVCSLSSAKSDKNILLSTVQFPKQDGSKVKSKTLDLKGQGGESKVKKLKREEQSSFDYKYLKQYYF